MHTEVIQLTITLLKIYNEILKQYKSDPKTNSYPEFPARKWNRPVVSCFQGEWSDPSTSPTPTSFLGCPKHSVRWGVFSSEHQLKKGWCDNVWGLVASSRVFLDGSKKKTKTAVVAVWLKPYFSFMHVIHQTHLKNSGF